jgi:hypothetical protein
MMLPAHPCTLISHQAVLKSIATIVTIIHLSESARHTSPHFSNIHVAVAVLKLLGLICPSARQPLCNRRGPYLIGCSCSSGKLFATMVFLLLFLVSLSILAAFYLPLLEIVPVANRAIAWPTWKLYVRSRVTVERSSPSRKRKQMRVGENVKWPITIISIAFIDIPTTIHVHRIGTLRKYRADVLAGATLLKLPREAKMTAGFELFRNGQCGCSRLLQI